MNKLLLFTTVSLLVLFGGCKKDQPVSYILYQNTLFTDISLTANGKNTIITAGNSVTFSGDPGQAFTYQATTSGKTSTGTQVGIAITFNNTDYFPSDANTTFTSTFKLNPADFYLYVTNSTPYAFNELVVNAASTDSTIDNITIPNDGNQYGTGYYHAYSNTIIDLYYNGGFYTNTNNPTYLYDGNGNTYYVFSAH